MRTEPSLSVATYVSLSNSSTTGRVLLSLSGRDAAAAGFAVTVLFDSTGVGCAFGDFSTGGGVVARALLASSAAGGASLCGVVGAATGGAARRAGSGFCSR